MYESRPGIELYYFYDSYGNLTSIRYIKTGETTAYSYYVTTNIQGDVLGIYTSQGIQVAAYEYDAWGNCTVYDVTQDSNGNNIFTEVTYSDSQKFNMEFLNPFRYRGYYYDQDMGLYYLQSRYYDPQVGRFINADSESLVVSNPLGMTDKNLFAYCDNNPVIREDNSGDFWNVVIGAGVGAVVGVAGQFASDLITSALNTEWTFSNWQTYVGAVVGGAAGGAVLGATGSVSFANATSGLLTTGVGLSLEKVTGVSNKTWTEIGVNAVADGAVSYGLGKLPGINKVTKGRNNMSAVYKSGLTKLRNKTATHMSSRVIGKGIVSSFVGGLAMDVYYGVKQFVYDRIKSWIS